MQQLTRQRSLTMAASAILFALAGTPVPAQQSATSTARVTTRPAAEVLVQIGRSAGVVVLADSTIYARLPVPTTAATPESVEQQIAAMVSALPAGTTWAKLYVPAPVNGRWIGDVVADYARAQARLIGTTIGRAAPAGTVEILGRPVPADKVSEYVATLNLKLVYLVTNPRAAASSASANWSQMTPDQQELYARQQAQRLLALDPTARMQALSQMVQESSPHQMIMKMVMTQMTDGERVQLKQSLGAGRPGGGKFTSK